VNVNLGTPYETIIERLIKKGYAGNQTEVIRQALMSYEREIEEEEVRLVNKAIEAEMAQVRSGKIKAHSVEEVKKRLNFKE